MRTVTLSGYPAGYFGPLVGMRMPAGVEGGRVVEGLLVAAVEGEGDVTLNFEDVRLETGGPLR